MGSNIPDPNWSERDDHNAENAPLGWPPGLPAKIELIGQMMMGAIKRFWNKANPVYLTTGTLDAYIVTTEGNAVTLNLYEIIRVRIDRANTTTTPTLKFAKTNARTIVKVTSAGVVPLIAGDMQTGRDHSFWFNGTNFVLSNPATIDSSVTVGLLKAANNLSDVASATTSLANLAGAPLASPALTGNPTAPTQTQANNSTRIATTAYVDTGLGTKMSVATYDPNGHAADAFARANFTGAEAISIDGVPLSLLSIFGSTAIEAVSNRNTAVFGTLYSASVPGFPCGVVGYGELNTSGGYVCGTYGHVIVTAGGIATNELCVENRAGTPNATLPPNRSAGSTDNLAIIQTIATLGGGSNNNVSIGTHYAKNGFSMLTGIYMAADATINNGIFIDATSTVSAATSLKVRGAGGKTSVADFQYMNVTNDSVPNTRWLDSAGSTLALVTAGGSIQATGAANALNQLRIGTGTPIYQGHLSGAGQATAAMTDAGSKSGALLLQDTGVVSGNGGALVFGATATDGARFAAIKGLLTSGSNNTTGDLAFSVRKVSTDTALTKAWSILATDLSFAPGTDNTTSLATASFRTSVVYSATAAINTSDANSKDNIRGLSAAEKLAADNILKLIQIYQLKDAIAEKGIDAARLHTGLIAQEVIAALEAEGLVARRYAFICEDEIFQSVTKTRTVQKPVMEDFDEEFEQIVVEGSVAVTRKVTRISQRPKMQSVPIVDENGVPKTQQFFVKWADKEEQEPIFEDRPMVHTFPVTEDATEEYQETETTGEKRLGLRYSELFAFVLGSLG